MASEFVQGGYDAEAKITVVTILDEVYFRLYHRQLMEGKQQKANADSQKVLAAVGNVLSPDLYFRDVTSYSSNSTYNLEKFLEDNMSSSRVKEMRELWEMDNQSNPLLRVFNSRYEEGISLLYNTGVGKNGEMDSALSNSRPKQWKKKSLAQPPCYPLLQKWRDACRDWCCHLYSYAVPTRGAIAALAKYKPLVEMGAGLGFWASLLRNCGVDIVAYDKDPTSSNQNEYHGQLPSFTEVKQEVILMNLWWKKTSSTAARHRWTFTV